MNQKSNSINFKNMKIGTADGRGPRFQMEDFTLVEPNFFEGVLIGVFDGHGGKQASKYAGQNIVQELKNNYKGNWDEAFQTTFENLHQNIVKLFPDVVTTACVAIIQNDELIVANAGDSRAVLLQANGNVIRLSFDHKPNNAKEKQFIKSMGGFVRQNRVNGILALSRALGDGFLGKVIRATPDITHTKLEPQSKVIIACDGVWDVMTDIEAANVIRKSKNAASAANAVRDSAFGRKTLDNVSAIVLFYDNIN